MYTVKILSEKDFDKLPYKKARTSLGLADAKNGVAYIRDTGYNDITKHTINHELDELVAKVSPHEVDGIRYKDMGGLASMGGGAGAGLLSNMFSGKFGKVGDFISGASPLISAGVGAAMNKDNRMGGALQGFAGGGLGQSLGSGIASGYKGFKNASAPGGAFGRAMRGFGSGLKEGGMNYLGEIPGMGGFGTSNPTGKLSQFFQGMGKSGTPPMSTGVAGNMPLADMGGSMSQAVGNAGSNLIAGGESSAVPSMIQDAASTLGTKGSASGTWQKLSEFFNKGNDMLSGGEDGNPLGGLALSMFGNLLSPKVEAPDFSGVYGGLRDQLAQGGPNNYDLPPDSAFTLGDQNLEKQKQDALDQLTNHWKNLRPGADFQNDSEFQKQYADTVERFDRTRNAQRDEMTFQYTMQQLNLNQQQMSQYIQIAQMEAEQIAMQYGISVGEAQQFKELFANMGQQIAGGTNDRQLQEYMDTIRTGGQ